ncbi:unnamed protein product [Rhizophagus irregularis]|nr:unnamed protein product [Rhizophagus irregularis]
MTAKNIRETTIYGCTQGEMTSKNIGYGCTQGEMTSKNIGYGCTQGEMTSKNIGYGQGEMINGNNSAKNIREATIYRYIQGEIINKFMP